jgi:hypothetical protein
MIPFRRLLGVSVLAAATAIAVLGTTAACSTPDSPRVTPSPSATAFSSTVISAASLSFGQPVAAPKGKSVLTVTGKITTHNKNGELVLDRATLERLGVRQVRLYEPWTKQDMDFRGIWLQDLLAVAGVQAGATTLHIVALDDYAVDLKLADVRAGGIMLATSAGDGSAIPIAQGGPTRVVFMNGVKAGVNPDQWVWSLKSIDVV